MDSGGADVGRAPRGGPVESDDDDEVVDAWRRRCLIRTARRGRTQASDRLGLLCRARPAGPGARRMPTAPDARVCRHSRTARACSGVQCIGTTGISACDGLGWAVILLACVIAPLRPWRRARPGVALGRRPPPWRDRTRPRCARPRRGASAGLPARPRRRHWGRLRPSQRIICWWSRWCSIAGSAG